MSNLANEKILVCDDDEGILDVVSSILTESGYAVEVCPGYSEVLDKLKSFKPQLVLMDLNLDGTHIEERIKAIRESDVSGSIPIILMSGEKDIETVVTQVGVQGFLSKPFELDDLLRVVESHLR